MRDQDPLQESGELPSEAIPWSLTEKQPTVFNILQRLTLVVAAQANFTVSYSAQENSSPFKQARRTLEAHSV